MNKQLVLDHIGLAESLVLDKSYLARGSIQIGELRSAAYMGLIEAAIRFNPSLGNKFTTYAYPCIIGAINNHVRMISEWSHQSKQKVPRHSYIELTPELDSQETINSLLRPLENQEKYICKKHYLEGYTMKEIGEDLFLTESRISQILKKSRKKMYNELKEENYHG